MRFLQLKTQLYLLLTFFLGFVAASVITIIHAQTTNNTIYACVKTNNGSLRIVDANTTCASNETPLSWNIQGPPGPAGSPGPSSHILFCPNCSIPATSDPPFNPIYWLKGQDLSSSVMSGTTLGYADLTGTSFSSAYLVNAGISNATLVNVNFSNAKLNSVDFTNSNLQNANFTNADLTDANFTNATNMSTANLTGVIWSNTTCPDGINSDNNGNTCEGHLIP